VISGYLIGDRALLARMGNVSSRVKAKVDEAVSRLGYMLQRKVQVDKLTGQVLRVRTDRLRGSISPSSGESASRFVFTSTSAIAYVGTKVPYGVAWERGISAHDIVPIRAKALRFEIGGEVVFSKRAHIPAQAARPFLQPTLYELRPVILRELGQALTDGTREAMRG